MNTIKPLFFTNKINKRNITIVNSLHQHVITVQSYVFTNLVKIHEKQFNIILIIHMDLKQRISLKHV